MGIDVLPRKEYEQIPAINISRLIDGKQSMAHLKYSLDNPQEMTDALRIGIALHLLVYEPGDFPQKTIVSPHDEFRTNAAKDWKKAQNELGIIWLKQRELDQINNMRDALLKHPEVAAIAALQGKTEVSLDWLDTDTGVRCKGRLDKVCIYNKYSWVWDLKSCKDATIKGAINAIIDNDYHVKASWYLEGMNTLAPLDRRWGWIFQEKEPPYAVSIYEPCDEMLEKGKRVWKRLLREYKEAIETKIWPSYPVGIETLDCPPYMK